MDKPLASAAEFNSQELKKKLLECLDQEAKHFSEAARAYFAKGVLSDEDKVGLLNAIITTVDHVIDAEEWDSSLFLRNTLKPLKAIREQAQAELSRYGEQTQERKTLRDIPIADNEVEVYISLFQSDGYNTGKWAMQLRSLNRYIVGRPVYANEKDVQDRIRLRGTQNEAYVAVVVKKSDIQSGAANLKDQYDHPLVTLKEVALNGGRIVAFLHQGIRYQLIDGQLVKQG